MKNSLRLATLAFVPLLSLHGVCQDAGDQDLPFTNGNQVEDDFDGLTPLRKSFSQEELEDIRLIAEARGWSIEESKKRARINRRLGRLANHLATNRPDIYAGAALSDEPTGNPTIYIKGEDDLSKLIAASGLEDADVITNQPYSLDEMQRREKRIHSMLVDEGYQNLMSSFDVTREGHIDVLITHSEDADLAAKTASDLMSKVSSDFTVNDVTITFQDEPVGEDFTAYGGMTMLDGSRAECTSGWSVVDRYGRRGVTTAGHCTGIDEIHHDSTTHSLYFAGQHRGDYGDIEWHLSNQYETANFYATSSSVRSVYSVEPVYSTVVGESICFYGRFSNDRDCSFDVYNPSISCTVNGISNSRLVQMTGNSAIGGDSGGGWSWGVRAYGSVKGICGGRAVFSHAGYYPIALGVWVITK